MKKLYSLALLTILLLTITGCNGGSHHDGPVYVADIFSDQSSDGDIAFDPVRQVFAITNGPNTLYFGIDTQDPNLLEYRAFLDFPLDGSTGSDVVPSNAIILSATLEVFVTEVSFAPIIPTIIDLVPYSLSGLRIGDFDSLPLLTKTTNFFSSDEGAIVAIDITSLMQEAQRLELSDLQLRFILDFAVNTGLVGFDDRPTVSITAPRLIVDYEF
ncbi:MAG: hypothetical protein KKB30_12985 [Proteobacteria bacterium]|nr:hypothetical protein [Pseudomonadota bacterium]MBU1714884.1 hypothetical protein [Pseudomonadota bacterium]